MAFVNENIIEEIQAANDIVDIVSEYVTLKRAGPSYKGLCPFHKEKTPSFSVSPEKQIFHCFGCGVGGNVIRFLMQVENIDFQSAIEILADRAKIEIPKDNETIDTERLKFKERLYEINVEAAKYFRNNLFSSEAKVAQDYINKRNLDIGTVKKFGLGFSFGIRNDLSTHLLSLGFTNEEMTASGLVIKNDNNFADRFKQRLMFPIFDVKDRVIAFGGRVLDDSLPKYMNSPETPIYSKSKNIYALNFARKAKVDKLLMVEGYMDVISLHKSGISNAIASLGTALTETQGRLMRKYASEIVLGYDADGAGQAAILRGLDILRTLGCNVKVMKIEGAKDPDEFVNKYGPDKLLRAMDNSITLVQFKLDALKQNIDISSTDGKLKFLNGASDILSKINNSIERELYVNKVAADLKVGTEPIYAEINKKLFGTTGKTVKLSKEVLERKFAKTEENIPQNVLNAEKILIFMLCKNDEKLFKLVNKHIKCENFRVNLYHSLAEKLYGYFENGKKQNIVDLFSDEKEINAITGIMQEDLDFGDNNEKALTDAIGIVQKYDLEVEKAQILNGLKNVANAEETETLERRLNDVITRLHSISIERRK